MADIVQLIYDNTPRGLPLVEAVLLAEGSSPNYYRTLVGNTTSMEVFYPLPIPAVVPGCVLVQQLHRGGPWVVVIPNFLAPVPPGLDVGGIHLVDGGPGPDGLFGTEDDEVGAGFDLYDDDGTRLVE